MEPGPDLEGTIIRERMSAEAEDWASDLIAGAKARMEASPESREGEVAAVQGGACCRAQRGASHPVCVRGDGCRSSRGSEAGHHAAGAGSPWDSAAVPKREEALRQADDGRASGGVFLWLMINPIADAEFISDEMLTWIGRFVYPLLINLILIFMTVSRGAQAARCRSFGAWALFVMCRAQIFF